MADSLIKTYNIRIVREPGEDPVTGESWELAEQILDVDTTSRKVAYQLSGLLCTLPFRGQLRRVFIDGEEFFVDDI